MSPSYRVTCQPYRRAFRQPIQTHHGIWSVRTGAIVTLRSDSGRISQGEIAPLEWFGTESLTEALAFCQALPAGTITAEQIFDIPDRLPCCQFAFESALDELAVSRADSPNIPGGGGTLSLPIAALLPTGPSAIDHWQSHYQTGNRTFKWKIGVSPIAHEIEWFRQLHQQLPSDCQLRLDANAGLSLRTAERWLDEFAIHSIEYFEQPLGIDQFATLKVLATQYSTQLALDESIAHLKSLQDCYNQGWPGIYVIKPAIVGSPHRLMQFLQHCPIDVVFSSVFETTVGYTAGLRLAARLSRQPRSSNGNRALGYGTKDWWV